MKPLPQSRETVPVVYDFFPHYRAGVNEWLLSSKQYEFLFVGGDEAAASRVGIRLWQPPAAAKVLITGNYFPVGRPLFQTKLLSLGLRSDVKQIIFLGCAEFATTWLAAAAAKWSGKRVWFWSHGWTSPDAGLKRHVRLAFYSLSHGMLLYSHRAKQEAVRQGIAADRLHVIYNSMNLAAQVRAREQVTLADVASTRAALFSNPALPTLICTGRLVPYRRLGLLLDAMHRLKQDGQPVNLLLVGEGPERSALEAQARNRGLNLRVQGECYDEGVLARLIMAADLTVVPGRVGLTAMHSFVYGRPVLTHDNPKDQGPEWEAVIPGYNGAHFSFGDPADLPRVIRQWFARDRDAMQLQERCHEVVERFYNPEVQATRILQALDGQSTDDQAWHQFCRQALGSGGWR